MTYPFFFSNYCLHASSLLSQGVQVITKVNVVKSRTKKHTSD